MTDSVSKRKPDNDSDDQKATKIAKTDEKHEQENKTVKEEKKSEVKAVQTTNADRLFGEFLDGNIHPMRRLRWELTGSFLVPVLFDIVFDYLRPRIVTHDWLTLPTGLPDHDADGLLLGLLADNMPVVWTENVAYSTDQSGRFVENKSLDRMDFPVGIEEQFGTVLQIPSSHRPIPGSDEKVEFGSFRVLKYNSDTKETSLHAIVASQLTIVLDGRPHIVTSNDKNDRSISRHGQILKGYICPYPSSDPELRIASFSASSTTYFALYSENHYLHVYRYVDLDRDPEDIFARHEFRANSRDVIGRKHDISPCGVKQFLGHVDCCAFDGDFLYVVTEKRPARRYECNLYILSLSTMTVVHKVMCPFEVCDMCIDSHGLLIVIRRIVDGDSQRRVIRYQMI
jgi:hypothetical protein